MFTLNLFDQRGKSKHLVEEDLKFKLLDQDSFPGAMWMLYEPRSLYRNPHPFWADPRITMTPHIASRDHDRKLDCSSIDGGI